MNVVFLDFDGVINIPYWYKDKNGEWRTKYNYPSDGCVNHFQAIQWVSHFCQKHGYDIVISSTWRMCENDEFNCTQCLYDSGLRKDIKILGKTPYLSGKHRGDEISQYLSEHPEIDHYLIFDDDSDMTVHMDKLVKCDCVVGFTLNQYNYAVSLHKAFDY